MKNKKIIILSGRGIHNCNTPAAIRMIQYMNCLSKNNNEIYIVSYREDNVYSDFLINNSNNNIKHLSPNPTPNKITIPKAWKFLNYLSSTIENFKDASVIIYPNANCKLEIAFLLWARIHKLRNIYCELNEVRRYCSSLVSLSPLKRTIYKSAAIISERFSKYYKGIICINTNIQKYYSCYNTNSYVIPTLSPQKPYTKNTRYSNDSDKTFIISFTGSVSIEKENLLELIKGIAIYNNNNNNILQLKLYGLISENETTAILNICKQFNIENNVDILGEIPHDKVSLIHSSSDCLILPRRNNKQNFYGFSTKLSEYLVSGTPVILTDTGVVSDYLTDGLDCIMVKGYDAEGFAHAFERLITMTQEQRSEMAYNAYLTASKHFNPYNYTTSFLKFLGIE